MDGGVVIPEATVQRLDPLGGLGFRMLTILVSAGACVFAVVQSVRALPEFWSPVLAVVALLSLLGSAAVVIFRTSPYGPGLSQQAMVLVAVLAFLGAVLEAAAKWGSNIKIVDDWGPMAIGLMLFAAAPHRPARQIASLSVLCSIGIGFLILLQSPHFDSKAPIIVYIVYGVLWILMFGLSVAAFVGHLVSALEGWHAQARQDADTRIGALRETMTRSVHEERMRVLGREVTPFFAELLAAGYIRRSDRERAHAIAESIRTLMVAEVDRTWLQRVAEVTAPGTGGEWIDDPGRLADYMTSDQRTAIRALIGSIMEPGAIVPGSLRVTIVPDGSWCRAGIEAVFALPRRASRRVIGPYLAVVRSVFHDLRLRFDGPTLTVKFSYDRF